MTTLFAAILLVSGLLFLGTAGYLIANARAVANLFGKRRRDAEPGEVVVDPRAPQRGASQSAIKVALLLHVLGIIGLVAGGYAMTESLLTRYPDADPLPPEMNPIPGPVPTR